MSKTLKLKDIATTIGARLVGEGDVAIRRLAHPADLLSGGELVVAMDKTLFELVSKAPFASNLSALVITAESEETAKSLCSLLIVERPRVALARLTALFAVPVIVTPGIHASAVIEEGTAIGRNPSIGAFVYIGTGAQIGHNVIIHPQCYVGENAVLGDNVTLFPGTKIGAQTQIGNRTLIHFGVSIGGDGFSFVTPQEGSVEAAKSGSGEKVTAQNTHLIRINSLAPVIIGDDVEIGANSSIDRGTLLSTRIGHGTKIDNQVQIGHNVVIGENCMICGRVGIAGSVTLGDRVVLGGAVGVADHVSIGDDAIAMGMSGIAGNIPAKTIVGGIPAMPREKAMETLFNVSRLKNFFKKIDHLGQRVEILEKKRETD